MKKTIMVHIDGIPAHAFEELGACTVLQAAQTPQLDDLARHGELGRIGIPNESRLFTGELAFLSLLGYDSQKWFTGPGVFESLNLEVTLDRNDVAYLCDFVTLRAEDGWGDSKKLGVSLVMDDILGGGLDTEEARELIDAINEQFVSENIQFYIGEHDRHLMVWAGGYAKVGCRNPREALGQPIDGYLATGDQSQVLRELMEASRMILSHHLVNQERIDAGLKPANCLWPWGQTKPVDLPLLKERWPLEGVVVSPSGPYRGVGIASGLKAVKVEAVTEDRAEQLQKMAEMAATILEKQDLACLHVPFPILSSDQGQSTQASAYVENLQQIDGKLIGALRQRCMEASDTRLFIVATPSASNPQASAPAPMPYVLYEGQSAGVESSEAVFDEQAAFHRPLRNSAIFFERFFGNA